MIRQYELIDKVLEFNPGADVALLNRAYVFSMRAHGNQKRASGEPYLVHPLEVASILVDLRLDEASIAVGLLHDTLEDTLATYDELKDLFGKEVADLTNGVTKLSKIQFDDKKTEQAENFRKLLLAMSEDIRVLLIKLADRTHNMRTLYHIKKIEKRKRIARETMDIYAPLADRIGLYKVKTELEDLSFKYLNENEHNKITQRLEDFMTSSNLVGRVIDSLRLELDKANIKADIFGRSKAAYSIFRKMQKKNLTFDQLTDIVAYRIIVDNQRQCYEVLGLIHDIYKAIPGRFKDYISSPKPNGYQSLHTSVIGPFGNRMEVQIRTKDMNDIAESGVAAHWLYKQSNPNQQGKGNTEGSQYKWLRQLIDTLQNSEDPDELLENTRLDLFSDNVFCFTPTGDLFALPKGATPLDFAYHIHSEVGHKCQTAKVNGRVVPLRTQLNTGDQVEIITSSTQKPAPGWREFVVSGKARAAINRYLRAQEFDEQVRLGREMLTSAAKRDAYKVSDKDLSPVMEQYKIESVDEAYASIAQGRLFPRQVFTILFPKDEVQEDGNETQLKILKNSTENFAEQRSKQKSDNSVGIQGLTPGISIHIARCCNPLPGEPIVGIINTGRGVTIHSKNCKNLDSLSEQPDRWMSVSWDGAEEESDQDRVFQARLRVALKHESGALSNFSTTIFNVEGNIVDLHVERKSTDAYDIRCDVEVRNIEHLETLLSALRSLSCVTEVERRSG